jgi:peptide/nickel transport system substrate-binding protein
MVEMAVTLKETAAPAGIRITISRDPPDTYWDKVWMQEPFFMANWLGRDPDSALSIVGLSTAPWNEAQYRDPVVDTLILKARGQTDVAARRETYRELQKILAEQAPRIIPVFAPVFMGLRDNVQGVEAHPANFLMLETASLK